jgi:glycine cleavage system pyridoxal-binding protein P
VHDQERDQRNPDQQRDQLQQSADEIFPHRHIITEIPSTQDGTVDLNMLEKTVTDKTSCFMLTNPNTLGIFESDILEISKNCTQKKVLYSITMELI